MAKYTMFNSIHTFGHFTRRNGYNARDFKNDKVITFFISNAKHDNKYIEQCVYDTVKTELEKCGVKVDVKEIYISKWKIAIDTSDPIYLRVDVRIVYD